MIITGSGDPTLGSWRYTDTKEDKIIASFKKALSQAGINAITGNVLTDESLWQSEVTPDGWSWQDIGNYYGAGATTLNWRENQYDLLLRSGNTIGTPVSIAGTIPTFVEGLNLRSVATAAAKGTGDRVYIYHPLNQVYGYVRGTIPIGESKFSISGAMPHPAKQLAVTLEAELKKITPEKAAFDYPADKNISGAVTNIYTHHSPGLDSISHWFLKRSINLSGEVLVKTFAAKEGKYGETDEGIKALQNFWKSKGISAYALNMMDGSGLSPGNRITTESLVQVLMYAKKQSWFASYYDGFPVINGIRMKSGSINGVIGYTGFVKNKSGDEYAFAFIVNNYNGSGSDVRTKMWKLLDQLK